MDPLDLITSRRSYPRLHAPAPDQATLDRMLGAACTAPDHAELRPWRFVVIEGSGLVRLGEVYAAAHRRLEPGADAGAVQQTAEKPLRAPLVVAVVCAPVSAADAWNGKSIPAWEQLAGTAAAVQNLLLAAHAEGFGAMWRTGWFGDATEVREALDLREEDTVVGWVYIGSVPDRVNLPPRRATPPAAVRRWP